MLTKRLYRVPGVGNHVRRLRAGTSQVVTAATAGVPLSTLSMVERLDALSLLTAERLAAHFKVAVEELLPHKVRRAALFPVGAEDEG